MTFLAVGLVQRAALGYGPHRVADRVLRGRIFVRNAPIHEGREAQHALLLLGVALTVPALSHRLERT